MAGTLHYRLKVTHIYQRRFEQSELAEALKTSHWYIITRRPAVRIIEGSANLDNKIMTVDVTTSADLASSRLTRTLGLDFGNSQSLTDFQTYENGAYFSVNIDGRIMHGDAWTLASLLSRADKELAAQEVLYIGEAFGTDGSTNVWNRVKAHEKLQRIYEHHADYDCDIFVAPLSLERSHWVADDHISDAEPGFDLEGYYKHFATYDGAIRKASVDLIEHSLISHFTPYYNEKLIEWRREEPTKSMRLMRETGFRLMQVHLSGWWGLARFYSGKVPDKFRSHLILHDLPPVPRRPTFQAIAADHISDSGPSGMMVREGQALLEDAAERTGVTIRVFGEQAPSMRKPPGLVMPAVPLPKSKNSTASDNLRSSITQQREEAEKENAPIDHPGKSTYDPKTGTIVAGVHADGTIERRRLHNPSTGTINSTLIFGDTGTGRSNQLLLLTTEALMTGLFIPAVADVEAKGSWRENFGTDENSRLFAAGIEESIKLLSNLCGVMDSRAGENAYKRPTRESPAVMLAVDDGDALLRSERSASLIMKILSEGGAVGIGISLVLGDILEFEDSRPLMSTLMTADYKFAYTPRGRAILRYLDAEFGPKRTRTWSNNDDVPLFVVHQDGNNAVLGFAVAWLNAENDADSAKRWANEQVRDLRQSLIGDWRRVGESAESFWNMDLVPNRWFLRRHDDVWLLVAAQTNMMDLSGPDLIEWAEAQIEARYEVDLTAWQVGPGVRGSRSSTFYIEASGGISVKDRSETFKRFIASLH
ncbi:hypothetical protein [Nocardia sp. NRRL S-836]|uniref:hypothetical protein n=1 Tax=Nocardia sp. NRRL S-836 TaxID=1519492 RepID=UPI0012F8EEB8|nr:hypothetical protein [Nocardia sp. NRRL S-836]